MPFPCVRALALGGLGLLAAGCSQQVAVDSPVGPDLGLSEPILQISNRVQILSEITDRLRQRIDGLEEGSPVAARLNVDRPGVFGPCHTGFGVLLVSVVRVEDYSGSHKVVVSVGNPSSAAILNTDWSVTWYSNLTLHGTGVRVEVPAGSQTGNWPGRLPPGRWSERDIILPCTLENLRNFSLTLAPKSVELTPP